MHYNLLSEPWIPVRWRDGKPTTSVGLRETILRAHEIRELATDNPLETIALNRLLLALVASAYPELAQKAQWGKRWREGRFCEVQLCGYLQEEWFDLLSVTRPFYQDLNTQAKEVSPLTRLMHAAASGNNATLFSHDLDEQPLATSLAAAARAIVCTQAAAVGGGVASPFNFCHAPLVGSAFFWLRGRPGAHVSLFEALMLNLPPTANVWGDPLRRNKDAASWELAQAPQATKREALGLRDLLTFQSRRLRLVTDSSNQAIGVYYNQGSKLEGLPFDNPHLAYRLGSDGTPYLLRFSTGRALWRDSGVFLMSLFDGDHNNGAHAPRTFEWLSEFDENLELLGLNAASPYEADVFGLVNDQAKVELWRHERITVHPQLLQDVNRTRELKQLLEVAEKEASRLRMAQKAFACRARLGKAFGVRLGDVERREMDAFVEVLDADRRYWPILGTRFPAFLSELATLPSNNLSQTQERWKKNVWQTASRALSDALAPFAQDARTWQALAEAETVLRQGTLNPKNVAKKEIVKF
jgi:CRISPR system Cascade subunit CasA